MRDTMWDSKPQRMVTPEGKQKGLKTVLEERGISVKGLHKEDMIKILQDMWDFKFQKTEVEEYS